MNFFRKWSMKILHGFSLVFVLHVTLGAATSSYFKLCHTINDWTLTNEDVAHKSKFFQGAQFPLFRAIPGLEEAIPCLAIGGLPTPVSKLKNLGAALNHPNLYIKNDALTSSALMGGNKPRKMAFLLAHALYNKARLVLTCGAAGSNSSTAVIAGCGACGLPCMTFLSEQLNAGYVRRNLIMSSYLGGTMRGVFSTDAVRQKAVYDYAQGLGDPKVARPYYISAGGSNARGSLGSVNAAFELAEQVKEGIVLEPDYIFVAAGSNGTAAGLALGIALAGLKTKIRAICATPMSTQEFLDDSKELCIGMLDLLGLQTTLPVRYPEYDASYFGGTYALITQKTRDALQLLQETEELKLDGTYAGKALAAFIDFAKANKDKKVLFWNTFCTGDFLEKLSGVDWHSLPQELHKYFDGTLPLQPGDIGV